MSIAPTLARIASRHTDPNAPRPGFRRASIVAGLAGWAGAAALLLLASSCGRSHDRAADTEQSSQELRKAEQGVTAQRKAVADNQVAIEGKKREIVGDQQALVDHQALLDTQRQQLGSAETTLESARTAYAAAVKARFAKLDAALAVLATRTDAGAKDALVGLRARRDQLAGKLSAMATAPAPSWNDYTKDIDLTFAAIERDLDRGNG
jgi:hypothetical protein